LHRKPECAISVKAPYYFAEPPNKLNLFNLTVRTWLLNNRQGFAVYQPAIGKPIFY
jgi:hypothetical protein